MVLNEIPKCGIYLPFQRGLEKFSSLVQNAHPLPAVHRRGVADAAKYSDILCTAHPAPPQHTRRSQQTRRKDVRGVLDGVICHGRLAIYMVISPDVSQDDMADFVRYGKAYPLDRPKAVNPDIWHTVDDRTHAVAKIVHIQRAYTDSEMMAYVSYFNREAAHVAVDQYFPRAITRFLIVLKVHNLSPKTNYTRIISQSL